MSAGDLSISRTSSSPSPSSSSSSSSYQHSAPRQRRAQPWHVFPVRVRSSRSSGSRSDVTETAAPPQSRRRSADGHGRHGSDARPRSSRRDNSSSATAGSTASGRWSLRTHTSSLGGESSMLPGVEFARRRRVHSVGRDGDSPGGGFGLVDGRPSRARPGSTVAHHHHHYHHHHHHHHHHYHQSASEQAATRTRSSSGGRLGGLRTAGEAASNEARPSSSRRQGASSSTASNTEGARSERAFRLPTWMQRSSTTNNLREEALEARDRLDERLRAAALVSQSARRSRTSLPGHPQADYSFVVPEADEHSSNSDEDVWETSMREWLAAWAPAGTEDRFRHDIRSRSTRMERPKGISKATIGALPRETYCTRAKKRVKEKGSCEQEECPVCLEHFVVGEVLLCLPCNHRFHPDCLTPWLESHGQCPYCRGKVPEAAKARGTAASTSAVDGVPDGEDLVSWMTAIERGITRLSFRVSNY